MILKDGSQIADRRLGRIKQFDLRSRNFSISEITDQKLPRSYTWRCNEWFDQGSEGACVGFALGHELAARPSEVKGLNYDYILKNIYWEAQKIDDLEGGSYPGANPQYDGTSVLAGVKTVQSIGWISGYRWAFNLQDAILGIGYSGPAVIGINWYEGMFLPDNKGFIKPTGNIAGGHAILVRGVNIKKGYVILRNSWGKSWGINGDCYLAFDDFGALLDDNGECCFLQGRKTKLI